MIPFIYFFFFLKEATGSFPLTCHSRDAAVILSLSVRQSTQCLSWKRNKSCSSRLLTEHCGLPSWPNGGGVRGWGRPWEQLLGRRRGLGRDSAPQEDPSPGPSSSPGTYSAPPNAPLHSAQQQRTGKEPHSPLPRAAGKPCLSFGPSLGPRRGVGSESLCPNLERNLLIPERKRGRTKK